MVTILLASKYINTQIQSFTGWTNAIDTVACTTLINISKNNFKALKTRARSFRKNQSASIDTLNYMFTHRGVRHWHFKPYLCRNHNVWKTFNQEKNPRLYSYITSFNKKNDINHDDGFYIQPSLSPFSTKKFENA